MRSWLFVQAIRYTFSQITWSYPRFFLLLTYYSYKETVFVELIRMFSSYSYGTHQVYNHSLKLFHTLMNALLHILKNNSILLGVLLFYSLVFENNIFYRSNTCEIRFLPLFVFAYLFKQPHSGSTEPFPGVLSQDETFPPTILAFSLENFKEIVSDTAK